MGKTRDPHNVALGRAIQRLRSEAALSQRQLADRAEMPLEELSQIEGGGTEATWGTLRQVASGLGVELADLFKLTEELERSGKQ